MDYYEIFEIILIALVSITLFIFLFLKVTMADNTSENTVSKRLVDLRVVDLKLELEKRSLEKTGVKQALLERLKKVIQGHTLVDCFKWFGAIDHCIPIVERLNSGSKEP